MRGEGIELVSGVPLSVWYLQGDGESQDVYDRYLTQAEIQGHINQVNGKGDTRRAGGALRVSPRLARFGDVSQASLGQPFLGERSESRQCVPCLLASSV